MGIKSIFKTGIPGVICLMLMLGSAPLIHSAGMPGITVEQGGSRGDLLDMIVDRLHFVSYRDRHADGKQ